MQPLKGVIQNGCFGKIRKIYSKSSGMESFLAKMQAVSLFTETSEWLLLFTETSERLLLMFQKHLRRSFKEKLFWKFWKICCKNSKTSCPLPSGALLKNC